MDTFFDYKSKTFQISLKVFATPVLLTVWKSGRWRVALHIGIRYYHN